jgi:hypothetical protein
MSPDHSRRIRTVILAGAPALLASLSLSSAPAHGAEQRYCGDGTGIGIVPTGITVQGDTCRAARKLANKVMKVDQAPWNGCVATTGLQIRLTSPCVRYRYRCRVIKRLEHDAVRISCRRGQRVVKWNA